MTALMTPVAGRVTQGRVARAELTKLRTLRSTWWTLGATLLLTVGVGVLISWAAGSSTDPSSLPSDVASRSQAGSILAQLALGVLAVLVISGEYGTGMIRSSMTCVPKRLPVLWAKAGVLVGVVLPLTLLTSLLAFFLGNAVWQAQGLPAPSLADHGVARIVLGTALYLTVVAVTALAVGTLLRSTAAGISTVVGVFFVLPVVFQALPVGIARWGEWLPSNAGGALTEQANGPAALAPWVGFAVLCAYAVAALAAAAWRLTRADV